MPLPVPLASLAIRAASPPAGYFGGVAAALGVLGANAEGDGPRSLLPWKPGCTCMSSKPYSCRHMHMPRS